MAKRLPDFINKTNRLVEEESESYEEPNVDRMPVTGQSVAEMAREKRATFASVSRIAMTQEQRLAASRNIVLYQHVCDDPEANLKYWPVWNEPFWDNREYETVNNCLAYSLMDRASVRQRQGKPQPGDRGGCAIQKKVPITTPQSPPRHITTCRDLTDNDYKYRPQEIKRRLLNDYTSIERELIFPEDEGMDPTTPPPRYYKIALLIAKTNGMYDYHFARMDSNGFWSHKPGATPVCNVDASGHLITDARTADWYYDPDNLGKGYNYDFYRYIFVRSDAPSRIAVMQSNYSYANKSYIWQPQLDYNPRTVRSKLKHAPDWDERASFRNHPNHISTALSDDMDDNSSDEDDPNVILDFHQNDVKLPLTNKRSTDDGDRTQMMKSALMPGLYIN